MTVHAQELITLLVPTINRSEFVERLLGYYRALRFRGQIVLSDASQPAHAARTRQLVDTLKGELMVAHHEYPGWRHDACWRALDSLIGTPYVAFLGDDDFLVPAGLERCVEFLERHPSYHAAHGVAALFALERSRPHGAIAWVEPYGALRAIEEETGAERLAGHLRHYSVTLFSVHRTASWQTMWKPTSEELEPAFATELLPAALSTIQGKIKSVDGLYLLRQTHANRYRHLPFFEWLTSPSWQPSYEAFVNGVAAELAQHDEIDIERARGVVRQNLQAYLAQRLIQSWRDHQRPSRQPSQLREMAKRIPGLRRMWRAWQATRPHPKRELSLPQLLRPSSPYHQDFLPVYQAVSGEVSRAPRMSVALSSSASE